MKKALLRLTMLGTVILVAGCTSTSLHKPANVVDKSTYAQPSTAPQTTTTSSSASSYTIRPGDTLYSIALRHGSSAHELMQLNHITDPTQLKVGQVILLSKAVQDVYEADTPADVRVIPIAVTPSASSTVASTKQIVTEKVDTAKSEAQSSAQAAKDKAQEAQSRVADKAAALVPGTKMIWPLKGKVVSNFKDTGKGLDIAGVQGDVVVAAMDGEVIYVGVVKGYKNLVIVKHSPTLVTAYGGTDRIAVKTGTHVNAGQKLAELGNVTGSPQLRFEVREKGQPVDPMQYLSRR